MQFDVLNKISQNNMNENSNLTYQLLTS